MRPNPDPVEAALALVETFSAKGNEWAARAACMEQFETAGDSSRAETAARILAAEVRRLRADRDATRESLRQ
jgi:hypothetical protein